MKTVNKTLCGVLLLLAGLRLALAADFPARPIRLIVPFGPGGSADIVARLVSAEAGKRLSQPVVVENRPGADGNIAAEQVARSPADGYVLLLGTSTLAIVRTLSPNLTYDLQRDLAPVINLGGGAFVMAVNAQSPLKSVRDLIGFLKARPNQANFASAASGSSTHLAGALFNATAGLDVVHVGYKSEPQALSALLANEVQFVVASYTATASFLQGGKLRAIAVTSSGRMRALPEVPTVAESGLQGFDAGYWNGIFAPAKTPQDVVETLYKVFAESAREAQTVRKLDALTFRVDAIRPEAFKTQIAGDIEKWAKVIRAAKVVSQ